MGEPLGAGTTGVRALRGWGSWGSCGSWGSWGLREQIVQLLLGVTLELVGIDAAQDLLDLLLLRFLLLLRVGAGGGARRPQRRRMRRGGGSQIDFCSLPSGQTLGS